MKTVYNSIELNSLSSSYVVRRVTPETLHRNLKITASISESVRQISCPDIDFFSTKGVLTSVHRFRFFLQSHCFAELSAFGAEFRR